MKPDTHRCHDAELVKDFQAPEDGSTSIPEPEKQPLHQFSQFSPDLDFHTSKLMATSAACIASAFIAYPSEKFRYSFTKSSLSAWDFDANVEKNRSDIQHHSVRIKSNSTSTRNTTITSRGIIFARRDWFSFFNSYDSTSDSQSKQTKKKQKIRLVMSPLVRLVFHEAACVGTCNVFEKYSNTKDKDTRIQEITAGAISGFCQALILCPLELHRANELKVMEEKQRITGKNQWSLRHWVRWTKSQMWEGGTGDPQERWRRAYQGVGTLAMREMVFNILFFPMFYGLWRYLDEKEYDYKLNIFTPDGVSSSRWKERDPDVNAEVPRNSNFVQDRARGHAHTHTQGGGDRNEGTRSGNGKTERHDRSKDRINMVASGMVSGLICSLAVAPLDVLKTYMMYSREQWSVWSGTRVISPPLGLLYRGMIAQAFILGPTFGIIAAVYELA